MAIYRLTPVDGVPVLRHAANLARATARGLREFPAGLRSAELVGLPELVALAAAGVPLPVAARQRLEVYKAVQRARAKAAARIEAMRDMAREAARAKREEKQARKDAEKARRRAEKAAEKKRKVAAERKVKRNAEKQQQTAAAAYVHGPVSAEPLAVGPNDSRLPWED